MVFKLVPTKRNSCNSNNNGRRPSRCAALPAGEKKKADGKRRKEQLEPEDALEVDLHSGRRRAPLFRPREPIERHANSIDWPLPKAAAGESFRWGEF